MVLPLIKVHCPSTRVWRVPITSMFSHSYVWDVISCTRCTNPNNKLVITYKHSTAPQYFASLVLFMASLPTDSMYAWIRVCQVELGAGLTSLSRRPPITEMRYISNNTSGWGIHTSTSTPLSLCTRILHMCTIIDTGRRPDMSDLKNTCICLNEKATAESVNNVL